MESINTTRLLIVAPNTMFVRLFLARQIEQLAAEHFDIRVLCAPHPDSDDRLADLPCKATFVDIPREIDVARDCIALFRLLSIIWQIKPAIVHVHGPKPSLLGAMAALLCGVPTRLHTIHGLRSDGLTGTRRTLVRTMERLTFACSTRCFAVSHSLAAHVVKTKLATKTKVEVLGYGSWAGVSLDRFCRHQHETSGTTLRDCYGISRNTVVVTYIGRLAKDKGISTLLDAWRIISVRHPSARLIVAGPPDAADPLPNDTMMRLQSDHSIVFKEGFVKNVPSLLAASDLFVQPSLREGLGVAALEAAAMELPVIASRVTGLVDTVDDNRTGFLFPAQDAAALADALHTLIIRPGARESFGYCGRLLVQERFAQADVLAAGMQMYTTLLRRSINLWTQAGKRALDLTISSLVLALASPIMLVVAAAVWLFLSRPVLFTQQRAGLHGKAIRIFKFRTMKQPAPGQQMIGTDEQRAHWLGSLLRKLSLDELPQLFNVVRGEMSLVGPRPLLLSYLPRYNDRQAHRHDALPGITGWAQVNGRNAVAWEERFELDLWYVAHRSLKLDLTILFLTLRRVVWPQGINPSGQTSMPEFLGASNQAQS